MWTHGEVVLGWGIGSILIHCKHRYTMRLGLRLARWWTRTETLCEKMDSLQSSERVRWKKINPLIPRNRKKTLSFPCILGQKIKTLQNLPQNNVQVWDRNVCSVYGLKISKPRNSKPQDQLPASYSRKDYSPIPVCPLISKLKTRGKTCRNKHQISQ